MVAVSTPDDDAPAFDRRRRRAYERANFLLSGAGISLTIVGISPNSPEVQAIRRALRALNQASGLDRERSEVTHVQKAGGPRFGKTAG